MASSRIELECIRNRWVGSLEYAAWNGCKIRRINETTLADALMALARAHDEVADTNTVETLAARCADDVQSKRLDAAITGESRDPAGTAPMVQDGSARGG